MTILRYYEMRASASSEEELRSALVELAGKVGEQTGCQGVDVHRDPGDDSLFVFIERWASLEAHRESATLEKGAYTRVMAALSQPPIARYLEPAN